MAAREAPLPGSGARPTVAVLGAGDATAFAVARSISRAGLETRAWNPTWARAGLITADGVAVAETIPETAGGVDVVLTLLPTDEDLLEAAGQALAEGMAWIQCAQIPQEETERCGHLARQRGAHLFDCPVVGRREPGMAGGLVVLASGPREGRDVVGPVLDAVGSRTMWVGETGAGTRLAATLNAGGARASAL